MAPELVPVPMVAKDNLAESEQDSDLVVVEGLSVALEVVIGAVGTEDGEDAE